jgi:hypothetical protein
MLSVSLIACGGANNSRNNVENQGNPSDTAEEGGFPYGYEFMRSNIAEDYSIAYSVTTYSGDTSNVMIWEQRRTADGYYLEIGGEGGQLLVKNGDEYDLYEKDSSGLFQNRGISVAKETAEGMTSNFLQYMIIYSSFGEALNKVGSVTIMGRDCDQYAIDYTYPGNGFTYTYTYCIDKQTGVCLKFYTELIGEGERLGYDFECTQFQLKGVELPSYIK